MVRCRDCMHCNKAATAEWIQDEEYHRIWQYECGIDGAWLDQDQAETGECPMFTGVRNE